MGAANYIRQEEPREEEWKDQGSVSKQDVIVHLLTQHQIQERCVGKTVPLGNVSKKRIEWQGKMMDARGSKVKTLDLATVKKRFRNRLLARFGNLNTFLDRLTSNAKLQRKVARAAVRLRREQFLSKSSALDYIQAMTGELPKFQNGSPRGILGFTPSDLTL
jgi:hypothetical protein